jgi:AbrB family looped-hinge helix DNA binding protein
VKEIRASVTKRGQVTIPAAVRRHLGVKTPDKVTFVLGENGTVTIEPVRHTVLSLAGTIRSLTGEDPGDFRSIIQEAAEEEAERVVAKMRRQ